MTRTRIGSWARTVLALLVIAGCNTGCGLSTAQLPFLGGEKMLLSIEATGAKPIPKTAVREIPTPTGGILAELLFESYAAPFIERATELDDCKLATTHEPPEPPPPGTIVVSATVICRLGPNKVRVREVVTFTLEPVVQA